jgi:hypothetical protein
VKFSLTHIQQNIEIVPVTMTIFATFVLNHKGVSKFPISLYSYWKNTVWSGRELQYPCISIGKIRSGLAGNSVQYPYISIGKIRSGLAGNSNIPVLVLIKYGLV